MCADHSRETGVPVVKQQRPQKKKNCPHNDGRQEMLDNSSPINRGRASDSRMESGNDDQLNKAKLRAEIEGKRKKSGFHQVEADATD